MRPSRKRTSCLVGCTLTSTTDGSIAGALITEPSGALAVAGIRQYVASHNLHGQTLVAINSGANINFDSLRHVAERVAAQGAV